ncbi:MAG: tetratricopeptide repeat protein, partial [Cyanobacteria bacterium P01_A01_bin.17]
MISSEQLEAIVERIGQDKHSKADIDTLRQLLITGEQIDLLQLGKYNINIGQGQDIQIGDRNYIEWNEDAIQSLIEIVQGQLPQIVGIPENLPRSGAVEFIGRNQELSNLHQQLQDCKPGTVAAITGMGGVGKTELALQYALSYKPQYTGGILWLQARGVDIGT